MRQAMTLSSTMKTFTTTPPSNGTSRGATGGPGPARRRYRGGSGAVRAPSRRRRRAPSGMNGAIRGSCPPRDTAKRGGGATGLRPEQRVGVGRRGERQQRRRHDRAAAAGARLVAGGRILLVGAEEPERGPGVVGHRVRLADREADRERRTPPPRRGTTYP